jgi:hypothetical protein
VTPEIEASGWLNCDQPQTLAALRGRVVAVEVFQMPCPDCVSRGLPQAQRIAATFAPDDVAVIGLHSVFEHHAAMRPVSRREYRIRIPVGVDAEGEGGQPRTMVARPLRGTATRVPFDRAGPMHAAHSGTVPAPAIGAENMGLICETPA